MFGSSVNRTRSRQPWIRIVIFVGLYLVLLLSLVECALVLYLYGTAQVDELMTPSLIIGLVASFLSVPFVIIHTMLSYQYRKVSGLNIPRNALHMTCAHLPRIMVAMWLAGSVTGLVVVSKQATCAAATDSIPQFWRAGMSCRIHRSAIALELLAFFTTSALFFCFQVCDRPYDASLLGLYAPQRPPRGGSIISESSWESETLKNEILYLCRHPDAGPGNGELYWSPNDSSLFENPIQPPSIRYPGPMRDRPQLHVNKHTNSVRPSIATSLTEKASSTDETAGSVSLQRDVSPLSRNPSLTSTLQPGTEAALTRQSLPPVPKIPDIPGILSKTTNHTRQNSSVSSRKFLPKDWLSEPLSEDPQIRALASPPLYPDDEPVQLSAQVEKDLDTDKPGVIQPSLPTPATAKTVESQSNPGHSVQTKRRSMSVGNPPPVLPPVPLMVRKSRSSYISPTPRSIHHPHHPNYVPPPTASVTPKSSTERLNRQDSNRYPSQIPKSINHIDNKRPLQRHKSTAARPPPRRQPSTTGYHNPNSRFPPSQAAVTSHGSIKDVHHRHSSQQHQRLRSSGSFSRNPQFPRHPLDHHNPRPQPPYHHPHPHSHHPQQQQRMIRSPHSSLSSSSTSTSSRQSSHPLTTTTIAAPTPIRPSYTRRFHSNDGRGFNPARTLSPIPRSDDTAVLYPRTRRPRSSIYGDISIPPPGTTGLAHDSSGNSNNQTRNRNRNSVNLTGAPMVLSDGGMVALEEDGEIISAADKKNMYRGAERTSECGGVSIPVRALEGSPASTSV